MKRLLALLLALLVHLMTLAFLVLGAWTILAHADSLLAWLLGGLCLAIGWVLRPRLARLPADAETLERDSAPELYAVAEHVADRVGVTRPRKIAIRDLATETGYDRVGLARTPVLVVGLPLWLALPPRQRVTLLASAYARVPTGEELIVGGALDTLEAWRDALMEAGPLRVREEAQTTITAASLGVADQPGTAYEVAGFFGRLLGRVLGAPVLLMRYALSRLARAGEPRTRDRRQALTRRVASAAEQAELEELRSGGYLAPMQAAALRGENAASIRQAALARSRLTADGVLAAAPHCELLGTRESERIDDELQAYYARAIRGFGLIS
ncbi:M48 family metalloprotease [Nonomuraea turcica]|uniref:hypothetical protein n=1 Tax=Nonomuraea sp. G32 TaxID=3067274 RepID=UPI00273A9F7C|nr:hypothetical protein [Nonomuraea sp. G32]MDP4506194.1 hypothetical protein [Nonomuraea sp. G32]